MRARERPEAGGDFGTQVRGARRRAGSIPNRICTGWAPGAKTSVCLLWASPPEPPGRS